MLCGDILMVGGASAAYNAAGVNSRLYRKLRNMSLLRYVFLCCRRCGDPAEGYIKIDREFDSLCLCAGGDFQQWGGQGIHQHKCGGFGGVILRSGGGKVNLLHKGICGFRPPLAGNLHDGDVGGVLQGYFCAAQALTFFIAFICVSCSRGNVKGAAVDLDGGGGKGIRLNVGVFGYIFCQRNIQLPAEFDFTAAGALFIGELGVGFAVLCIEARCGWCVFAAFVVC